MNFAIIDKNIKVPFKSFKNAILYCKIMNIPTSNIFIDKNEKKQKIFNYKGYKWIFEDWIDYFDKCHKHNYGVCVTSHEAKKSWNIAGKHVLDYCDKNKNLDYDKCKELIDKNFNHR